MDAEAIHKAEGARKRPVGHDPHHHVHAFRRQGDEVPEVVMRRLRLREAPIRFLLHGMDQIRELDGVLNEKHRDIVPNDVPVPFLRIELHGKAADVARQVSRALVTSHGREPYEGRGLLPGALKEVGFRDGGKRRIVLEIPAHPEAAGMHHPLGDTLMVETEELLAQVKIFERRGATGTDLERILIVGNWDTLLRGQDGCVPTSTLVHFSASTGHHALISVLHRVTLVGSAFRITGGVFLRHILLLYEHVSCEHVSCARCQKIPSLLSPWSTRQGTSSESFVGAQSMPGKRWENPTGAPQASRQFDAVFAAWWAASLSHSERSTLILKRVCGVSYLSYSSPDG